MKNLLLFFLLVGSFAYAESNDTSSLLAPHMVCVYHDGGSDCFTFEDSSCEGDVCFTGIQMR